MKKRKWSIILLCLTVLSFIAIVYVFVNTGILCYQLKTAEIDTSNDMLPGASVLSLVSVALALWFGFVFIGGVISSVGYLCSLVNSKIAENPIIKRISKISLYFFAGSLLVIFLHLLLLLVEFLF